MDVFGESGPKRVRFPLKYNTSVYVWLTPFKPGVEYTPLQVFPPCCHRYQPISSKVSVFNFLLWKHALTKNVVNYFSKRLRDHSCGKRLTHFSLYLYRIFRFLLFLISDIFSFNWVKKKTLCWSPFLSKHWNLANLLLTSALLKKYRILIIFLAFSTQNLTIVWHSWLFSD